MSNKKSVVCAIGAVFMWGFMPTITKLIMNEMDPLPALAYTSLFATITMLLYIIIKHDVISLINITKPVFIRMTLIGSLGVFFYNYFYFSGASTLPAQTAYIINDLWPALIIVFSFLILKEDLTFKKVFAIITSFIGIIIVTTNGSLSALRELNISGIIFCLLAAVSYGLYSVLNKRESYNKAISVFVAYATCTIVSFVIVFITKQHHLLTSKEIIGNIINGVVCNALPTFLLAIALENGNTAVTANLTYLTPVVSLIVTHYVLGEKITVYSIIGILFIISGIFIQSKRKSYSHIE